ncbi:MAG: chloride channel protein, partial [Acidimicrobiia bacterium]
MPSDLLDRPAWRATHRRLHAYFGVRLRLVAAIVVCGLVGGALGAAYLSALEVVHDLIGPSVWTPVARVAVLASVGVVVVVLIRVLGRPADVELLVDNIHVPDAHHGDVARLRSLVPVSLACIGAGGTLGPEAPIVTTNGTLAHRYGTRAGLEPSDVRTVTITGMAAGFAVLFGAPLGAALFALELPHRRGIGYHEAAIPACIGAVIGYACSTAIGPIGLDPIWQLPLVGQFEWIDLPWSVVAGAVGALIALVFTLATRALSAVAEVLPIAVRPAVGGAALGVLALYSPYALTNGEFQIEALAGTVGATTLVIAASAKLAGAAACVATGWRGGFIIPMFFVGFCVGRLIVDHLPGAHEWPFVLGVMIAANVGVTKTPLGSTTVVAEMSGSTLLPGLLVASLASLVLTAPMAV